MSDHAELRKRLDYHEKDLELTTIDVVDCAELRSILDELEAVKAREEAEWHFLPELPSGSGNVLVCARDPEAGGRFVWPSYFLATVPDPSRSYFGDIPDDWEVLAWRKLPLPPALAASEPPAEEGT